MEVSGKFALWASVQSGKQRKRHHNGALQTFGEMKLDGYMDHIHMLSMSHFWYEYHMVHEGWLLIKDGLQVICVPLRGLEGPYTCAMAQKMAALMTLGPSFPNRGRQSSKRGGLKSINEGLGTLLG